MLRLVQLIASSALLFSPMAYAQPSAAPPPSTKLMAIGGTQLQYAELGAGSLSSLYMVLRRTYELGTPSEK
jgi:hypothetical protein